MIAGCADGLSSFPVDGLQASDLQRLLLFEGSLACL